MRQANNETIVYDQTTKIKKEKKNARTKSRKSTLKTQRNCIHVLKTQWILRVHVRQTLFKIVFVLFNLISQIAFARGQTHARAPTHSYVRQQSVYTCISYYIFYVRVDFCMEHNFFLQSMLLRSFFNQLLFSSNCSVNISMKIKFQGSTVKNFTK